jgi:Arc/MetJ-type ribon-helix-helix transcriptional regulator
MPKGDEFMQLTVRMPDEYKKKIELLSRRLGLKKSDVVRLAVKQFTEENLDVDDRPPYERIRGLIGIAKSGVTDLGLRHRHYLAKRIKGRS